MAKRKDVILETQDRSFRVVIRSGVVAEMILKSTEASPGKTGSAMFCGCPDGDSVIAIERISSCDSATQNSDGTININHQVNRSEYLEIMQNNDLVYIGDWHSRVLGSETVSDIDIKVTRDSASDLQGHVLCVLCRLGPAPSAVTWHAVIADKDGGVDFLSEVPSD